MVTLSTLRIKAVLENVPTAIDFVAHSARVAGFDGHALYEIQVAVDEACANVVCHAYAGLEAGDMEVSCTITKEGTGDSPAFVIRVRDWGASFDPEAVAVPDVTLPLEQRPLGGLGLYLIYRFMDRVQFSFDPQLGNELTMVKRLPGVV